MVQLVERLLAKEKVVGSSPIARSIVCHGVVAKWEGKGLQNPDHGFKSRRRLSELLNRAAFFPHTVGITSGAITQDSLDEMILRGQIHANRWRTLRLSYFRLMSLI